MSVQQVRFKGFRDDIGANFTSPEYLRSIENWDSDDLDGANKTLFPAIANTTEYVSGADIDGGFEYRYLDTNNVLQVVQIVVTGGQIRTNALGTTTTVYTGLTAGKICRFAVLNDKLFITNGVDYPVIYWGSKGIAYQMGAVAVQATSSGGNPNGTYRYMQSVVTSGGEENVGTISNSVTVNNRQITVNLTIGFSGVTSRKLYRTTGSGSTYLLLATISDNTTLTYTDNIADGSLGAAIPAVNNAIPKFYLIENSYNRIVGAVSDMYPTQIFPGGTSIEMLDLASFSDISNIAGDNTKVVTMEQQFSQVVVGSGLDWYLVDCSGTTVTVKPCSLGIGVASNGGYATVSVPANNKFPGGVMFLSGLNDIRVLNGLTGLIAATINNIDTENWAQVIKGSLDSQIPAATSIYGYFSNYKYHLIVGSKIFVFNTKTLGWSTQNIMSTSVTTIPKVLFEYNKQLYMGLKGKSFIELMYQYFTYHGQDYTATLQTASIPVKAIQSENGTTYSTTEEYKYFEDIVIKYVNSGSNNLQYTITIDDNYTNQITGTVAISGGYYDINYYSKDYYSVSNPTESYQVIRINRHGRYLNLKIVSPAGVPYFRGYELRGNGF